MWACTAPNCESDLRKKKFFTFPSDENRRKLWIQRCHLSSVSHNAKICEDHFEKSQFLLGQDVKKLKPDATPTLFPDSHKEHHAAKIKSVFGVSLKRFTTEKSKSDMLPPLFSNPVKVLSRKINAKQLEVLSHSEEKNENTLNSPSNSGKVKNKKDQNIENKPGVCKQIHMSETQFSAKYQERTECDQLPVKSKINSPESMSFCDPDVPQSSASSNLNFPVTEKCSGKPHKNLRIMEDPVIHGKPEKSYQIVESNNQPPEANCSQVSSEQQMQVKCDQFSVNGSTKPVPVEAFDINSVPTCPVFTLPDKCSPAISPEFRIDRNQSGHNSEVSVNSGVSRDITGSVFIAEKTANANEILVREIGDLAKKHIEITVNDNGNQSPNKTVSLYVINNGKTNKSKSIDKRMVQAKKKLQKGTPKPFSSQNPGINSYKFTNIHNQTFEIVNHASPSQLSCRSARIGKDKGQSSRFRKCKKQSKNYMCNMSFGSDNADSESQQHCKRKSKGSEHENSKKLRFGGACASDSEVILSAEDSQSRCSFNMSSEDKGNIFLHPKPSDTLLDEMIELYQDSIKKLEFPNQVSDGLIMPSMPTSNVDNDNDDVDPKQLVARMKQWNEVLKTELLNFREKYKNEHKKNEVLMATQIRVDLENKKLKQDKIKMKRDIRDIEKAITKYENLVTELELKVSALSSRCCVHLERLDMPMHDLEGYILPHTVPQPLKETGGDSIKHTKKTLLKEKEIEFQKKLLKMLKIKNENKKIDLLIKEFESERENEQLRLRIKELENQNGIMIEENEGMLGEIEQYIKDNKKLSIAVAEHDKLNNEMKKQISKLLCESSFKSKKISHLKVMLDKCNCLFKRNEKCESPVNPNVNVKA